MKNFADLQRVVERLQKLLGFIAKIEALNKGDYRYKAFPWTAHELVAFFALLKALEFGHHPTEPEKNICEWGIHTIRGTLTWRFSHCDNRTTMLSVYLNRQSILSFVIRGGSVLQCRVDGIHNRSNRRWLEEHLTGRN